MAGLAQSSARWPRLSQADSDRTLFRRLRLPSAQDHRRSRWPHAREREREGQRRRTRRMATSRGISGVAIPGRSDSVRARSAASVIERAVAREIECALAGRSVAPTTRGRSSGPHPIRRFAPPSPAELEKGSALRQATRLAKSSNADGPAGGLSGYRIPARMPTKSSPPALEMAWWQAMQLDGRSCR